MSDEIPLVIHEVPSGEEVFDWIVPNEWNIREAYIETSNGERLVDFKRCSLHVIGYSTPVQKLATRAELDSHLYSLPTHPNTIPYKTSYYVESWGFCINEHQRSALGGGPFSINIDTTLAPGALSYGEVLIPGELDDEFLISTHCCHPYMANDNLSGIGIAIQLAKRIARERLRFTYRFIFIPATIGSLVWLSRNDVSKIRHGLVLSCLGDRGEFTYKKTRSGNAPIDQAIAHVLRFGTLKGGSEEFTPYGYDERQFNSPGFKLPVGCLMRTPNGRFPEYHTSDDNLDFISVNSLAESFELLCSAIEVLEHNERFINVKPFGEPQLGKRGLYGATPDESMPSLWVLNLSDGETSLLEIADRANLPFKTIYAAAVRLVAAELLQPVSTVIA